MDKIDRLIIRALDKTESKPDPWKKAMQDNIYVGQPQAELLELLSSPRDDWRQIVQAAAWGGGG